ncbi:hypothetical protein ACMBCN_02165 [Candidatus Liberibacter asiaticus]|nr:hypothetical protein [Candidatus Liberibacter asiaticus]
MESILDLFIYLFIYYYYFFLFFFVDFTPFSYQPTKYCGLVFIRKT